MSRLREFALKILLRKEKGIMAVIYATLIVKRARRPSIRFRR